MSDDSGRPDGEGPSGARGPTSPLRRPANERERLAEAIAGHLDMPMTGAGVIFLLLVAAETITDPEGAVGTVFTWLGWSLWVLFVAEFLLRLVIAPSTAAASARSARWKRRWSYPLSSCSLARLRRGS